jgi:ribose transport system substrate-binding protein
MLGVTIVADISPLTVDEAGGAATMRTVLLAEPDIDVVLGADTVVLGALAALRETGKARPDQFLGGIDGEPAAVAEIKSGGSTRRASVSHRQSSPTRWGSTRPTGSKAKAFRRPWTSCRAR